MKTTFLGIGLGVILLSGSAFADEGFARGRDRHHSHGWYQGHTEADCGNQPQEQYTTDGRYELRSVQRWVPGRYMQVWVAQACNHYRHRHGQGCNNGYYQQQWQAGHYETVQEWVFVPYARSPRYGAAQVPPPPRVGLSYSSADGSAYVNASADSFGFSFTSSVF
ncbi:MAG: hypothetical protein K1X64_02960 [Myxococcaceae bacterium]|nr:hypothetical protein [Myxococcaceae bacterium]